MRRDGLGQTEQLQPHASSLHPKAEEWAGPALTSPTLTVTLPVFHFSGYFAVVTLLQRRT